MSGDESQNKLFSCLQNIDLSPIVPFPSETSPRLHEIGGNRLPLRPQLLLRYHWLNLLTLITLTLKR